MWPRFFYLWFSSSREHNTLQLQYVEYGFEFAKNFEVDDSAVGTVHEVYFQADSSFKQ